VVDTRLFELLNRPMGTHDGIEDAVERFMGASVPLFVAATILLWFLARPGGSLRWKVATVCALASAGLGLLVNQVISHIWARPRPFVTHPDAVVVVARTHDPSFPSDHATAAFAIAFAVLAFSLPVGCAFLSGATLVAITRVAGGMHYPSDVAAGALIGLLSAVVVVGFANDPAVRVAVLGSRVTDPFVGPVRRRIEAALRPRRHWRA
jgi:undecaprenyl-diphosphatase